jgi:hypothetical protein
MSRASVRTSYEPPNRTVNARVVTQAVASSSVSSDPVIERRTSRRSGRVAGVPRAIILPARRPASSRDPWCTRQTSGSSLREHQAEPAGVQQAFAACKSQVEAARGPQEPAPLP